MSIPLVGLTWLLPILDKLPNGADTKILTLGTQDLSFTYDDAARFLREHGRAIVDVPVPERKLTNGFATMPSDLWKYRNFIHQDTLFRMLGFSPGQVKAIDVDDYEGADILHNLNEPIPENIGTYDLVINQGTMEHIFDVRQFLWNLSDLTKIDGRILHLAPAGFLNHGFYNLNICLFQDFYGTAGWETEELYYTLTPHAMMPGTETYARIAPEKIKFIPEGFYLNITGLFRKTASSRNTVPLQRAYANVYEFWNDQSRVGSTQEPTQVGLAAKPSFWPRAKSYLAAQRLRARLRRMGAEIVDVRAAEQNL